MNKKGDLERRRGEFYKICEKNSINLTARLVSLICKQVRITKCIPKTLRNDKESEYE